MDDKNPYEQNSLNRSNSDIKKKKKKTSEDHRENMPLFLSILITKRQISFIIMAFYIIILCDALYRALSRKKHIKIF